MTQTYVPSIVACAVLAASLVSCANTALVKEGDTLFEKGDFAAAAKSYEIPAKDNPDDEAIQRKWTVARVFANLDQGRRLVFQDKLLDAFVCFEEVLRIDPQNETAPKWIAKTRTKFVTQKVNEGFELLADENYSAATDSFQRALIYDPHCESAVFGLERIRTVLDKQLAKADDYLLRGVRDRAASLVSQAAANFSKAADLNPADPKARIMGQDSRHQLAQEKFDQAQKLEADGHLGAALVQYRSIRTIDPEFPGLAEKLGMIEVEIKAQDLLSRGKKLLARGEFEAARRSFEEGRKLAASVGTTKQIEDGIRETQEREISSLYLAGRSMEQVSRFQEAIDKYEAVLKIVSYYEDTIARLDLARAAVAKAGELYGKAIQAEEAGEKAAALQTYQEIFAFYPKFRDVAERIEKLK